jgi:hypothetical protein
MRAPGAFRRCERREYFRMSGRIGPVFPDGGPLATRAFVVTDGVVDHERLDTFRMGQHDSKPDWTAVVMQVKTITVDAQLFEQTVDRFGQAIERVSELCGRRRATLTKPG